MTPPSKAWITKASILSADPPENTSSYVLREFKWWCSNVAQGPFAEDPWTEYKKWARDQREIRTMFSDPLLRWPETWELIREEPYDLF